MKNSYSARNAAVKDIKSSERNLLPFNQLIKESGRIIEEKDTNFNFLNYQTT